MFWPGNIVPEISGVVAHHRPQVTGSLTLKSFLVGPLSACHSECDWNVDLMEIHESKIDFKEQRILDFIFRFSQSLSLLLEQLIIAQGKKDVLLSVKTGLTFVDYNLNFHGIWGLYFLDILNKPQRNVFNISVHFGLWVNLHYGFFSYNAEIFLLWIYWWLASLLVHYLF